MQVGGWQISPTLIVLSGTIGIVGLSCLIALVLARRWTVQIPPFRALLVQNAAGGRYLLRTGSRIVFPSSRGVLLDPALRELMWQTEEGGTLVLADGRRLAVALRLWFQIELEAAAAKRAVENLGERLDPDRAGALARLLGAPVQSAVANVSRHWSGEQLPSSSKVRTALLDSLDESFQPLGLVASEIEILRLEVVG